MTASVPMVLHDDWHPSLAAGVYTIAVEHLLSTGTTSSPFNHQQVFEVQAPRLALDAALVGAAYPVLGTTGAFQRTLPHVCLHQPTLPWQRTASSNEPWLALLVLHESELPFDPNTDQTTDTRPVAEMFPAKNVTGAKGVLLPDLVVEPVPTGPDQCRTIDLPAATFAAVVPRLTELASLIHVRRMTSGGAHDRPGATDLAVVLANRFPRRVGRYSAHLVSLEGHGAHLSELPKTATDGTSPVQTVRLASLHSWAFTTAADINHGFVAVAEHLRDNSGPTPLLMLPPASKVDDEVGRRVAWRLRHGYVPLRHQLPDGERTQAWFRGPFTPTRPAALPVTPIQVRSEAAAMIYLAADGVFDVSYASAVALGKVLGLADPSFASRASRLRAQARDALVYFVAGHPRSSETETETVEAITARRWRRRAFTDVLAAPDSSARAEPAGAGASATPFVALHDILARARDPDSSMHRVLAHLVRDTVTGQDEFTRSGLLARVPFEHLVPDERMLPPESVRFFHLDAGWVDALVAGVAALGVSTGLDDAVATKIRDELGKTPLPVAGMLVRSIMVRDWPSLIVDAGANGHSVSVEVRHLAPDLLLAYFTAVPDMVRLRQPPKAPDFGLDGDDFLDLRHTSGDDIGKPLGQKKTLDDTVYRAGREAGVLDLGAFVAALEEGLKANGQNVAKFASAALALQLVNTPGQLEFSTPHDQEH